MKNTTMNHSAAVLFTLMFSIVSGPGAYSQTAYNALAAGGISDGAPGLRAHYQENYYAAFIRDPDGNRIEAVTFLKDAK